MLCELPPAANSLGTVCVLKADCVPLGDLLSPQIVLCYRLGNRGDLLQLEPC